MVMVGRTLLIEHLWGRFKIISFYNFPAKSLQSCPTLCHPIDSSPAGSPIPGILQARTLEWGATAFSNAWKWKVKVKSLSRVRLLATQWTLAHQAPPSMGFSRQEYWSEVPLPSPVDGYTVCFIPSKIMSTLWFSVSISVRLQERKAWVCDVTQVLEFFGSPYH